MFFHPDTNHNDSIYEFVTKVKYFFTILYILAKYFFTIHILLITSKASNKVPGNPPTILIVLVGQVIITSKKNPRKVSEDFLATRTDLDVYVNYIYFHLSGAIDTAPLWGIFLLSQPQVVI